MMCLWKKKINLPYEEIKADKLNSRPHALVYSKKKKDSVDVRDKDKWIDKFERDLGAEN